MTIYHVRFVSDADAERFAAELRGKNVVAHVSRGFENIPAVVVAYLDDNQDAKLLGENAELVNPGDEAQSAEPVEAVIEGDENEGEAL